MTTGLTDELTGSKPGSQPSGGSDQCSDPGVGVKGGFENRGGEVAIYSYVF